MVLSDRPLSRADESSGLVLTTEKRGQKKGRKEEERAKWHVS